MKNYSSIEKLPEVPPAIIEAVNNDKLVVFIGAGVSRIIGCMGWSQLASNLINICFTTQNKEKTGTCISFKEKESLEKENDHKKVITICHHILCEKNNLEEDFFNEFNKSLKSDDKKENKYNIYKEIFGWEIDIETWPNYGVVNIKDSASVGVFPVKKIPEHGMNLVLEVKDIDETLKVIEQAGGKIKRGKYQIDPEVGYSAQFLDCFGNELGLFSRE